MAITTLDGAIAGAQPPDAFLKVGSTMEAIATLHSLAYVSGQPGAAVAPSPGLAGAALTTYAGQIPFSNPVTGNSYLFRFDMRATGVGVLILYDRLWHNSGFTVTTTTAQTVSSSAFPARDADGTISGSGVQVAVEVSTATTNAGAIANMTLTYTNSTNTGSRTATMTSFPATAVAGTFVPFQLQAGDLGVKSIEALTLGTSLVTGVVHLVAYRELASIGCFIANTSDAVDALTSGFVRMHDNTVPFLLWHPSATTGVTIAGKLVVTQG